MCQPVHCSKLAKVTEKGLGVRYSTVVLLTRLEMALLQSLASVWFLLLLLRAFRRRPTCALCSKVMPVKCIYILNVVVKQEILIKTGKQNRRRIVVLHATEFHLLQKYQSQDKTSIYTTLTV